MIPSNPRPAANSPRPGASNRRPGRRLRYRGGLSRASRRSALVIAALGASLAVAACGSSSTATGTAASASASSSTSSQAAARQKFAACLKQHGVTLPSRPYGAGRPGAGRPGGGYGPPAGSQVPGTGTTRTPNGGGGGGRFFGAGNSKFAKAFQACAKYRPNFPNRAGRGNFRPRFSTKALATFVTCVRKHGYPQMPNPKRTSSGGFFPKSIESNPKFKAAAAKCQSVLQKALQQARGAAGGAAPTSTTGASSQA